jgi:hypothetical protein
VEATVSWAVSGGGPKSCSMRLWDVDVNLRRDSRDLVVCRLIGEGGPKSCSMRLWDAHRTAPNASITLSWSAK